MPTINDRDAKTNLVIAMQDSPFSVYFLRALLLNPNYCVTQVCICSSPIKNKSTYEAIFILLRKLALGYFFSKIVESVIYIFASSLSRAVNKNDLISLSKRHNFRLVRSNNTRILRKSADKNYGLVSLHYLYIIEDEIINDYAFAINFHPALLPFGRGLSPQFHMLLKTNEVKTQDRCVYGGSLHHISPEIDSGELIKRRFIFERDMKSSTEYMIRIHGEFFEIFKKEKLLAIDLNSWPDEIFDFIKKNKSRYFSYPSPKDFKNFKKDGFEALSIYMYVSFIVRLLFLDDCQRITGQWLKKF